MLGFYFQFYRAASAYVMYDLTNNIVTSLRQFLEMDIFVSIYKCHLYGFKTYSITRIKFMEAIFESGPQLIVQLSYLLKDTKENTEITDPFFIFSLCISFISLASGVFAQDNCSLAYKSISAPAFYRLYWRLLGIIYQVLLYVLFTTHFGGIGCCIYIVTQFLFSFISYSYIEFVQNV